MGDDERRIYDGGLKVNDDGMRMDDLRWGRVNFALPNSL